MNKVFSYIPGFRSNKGWKKVLASLYYVISLAGFSQGVGLFIFFISWPFIILYLIDWIKQAKNFKKAQEGVNEERKQFNTAAMKFIFSIVVMIISIGIMSSGSNSKQASSTTGDKATKQTVAGTQVNASNASPAPTATPTSTPTKVPEPQIPQDLNGYIKYIVEKELSKETNMKTPKLREASSSNGIVTVALNADDNFTNNMIITGMTSDAYKVLKAVSTRDDIKQIAVTEWMPLQDKYGKEQDVMVYSVSMKKENLSRVVWGNVTSSDVQKFADNYFVHPVFKK